MNYSRKTTKSKKINKHKKVFDKEYFRDYYFSLTGNFSSKDLERNKNWFWGWFKALEDMYDFSKGKNRKVLEVGCAIGAAANILSERGFKVTATDISPFAVKKAAKLTPNADFEVLDIETTKKYSKNFDLLFSFEVIEHLEKHEEAVSNMYRMLKKGGSVMCSTPFPYSYVFFDKTHVNVRHPLDWRRIFIKAGFKNIKIKQVGFVPFFYRFSKDLHFTLPFGLPTKYINSPVFIYGEK